MVEVCLAILSACTPTFPALLRWRSLRANSRLSVGEPKRSGSAGFPALVPDERRAGFRSDSGYAHKNAVKMSDWSQVTKDEEQDIKFVEETSSSNDPRDDLENTITQPKNLR